MWIKDLSVARHQAWRSAGKVVMLRFHEYIPVWIKVLSVARHQAWRSAGKVVLLRCHEIIPDQHRHRDWPKGTLHASYAHVAYVDTERF